VLPLESGEKGPLPFNYECDGDVIDLVVGETGCTEARSLLESSDLSICAVSTVF
jgi:hypothetical protein